METNNIQLLDVVALTVDLTEYNLSRGQVGTVVEILADGKAFEVEGEQSHSLVPMNLWVYAPHR